MRNLGNKSPRHSRRLRHSFRTQGAPYDPSRVACILPVLMRFAERRKVGYSELAWALSTGAERLVEKCGTERETALTLAIEDRPDADAIVASLDRNGPVRRRPKAVERALAGIYAQVGKAKREMDDITSEAEVWRQVLRDARCEADHMAKVLATHLHAEAPRGEACACGETADLRPVHVLRAGGLPRGRALQVDHWVCPKCHLSAGSGVLRARSLHT